jgi:hypothetical protein
MMTTKLACCAQCAQFLPDKVGSGDGLGKCREYSTRKRQGASTQELRELLIIMGNDPNYPLFWGGTLIDRKCERFIELTAQAAA